MYGRGIYRLTLVAFIAWGVLMVRPIEHVWYHPDGIFGALILFGIASYLGTYLLSKVIRKAGYAAALGLHLLFFVLYFIAYVANQFGGSAYSRHESKFAPLLYCVLGSKY